MFILITSLMFYHQNVCLPASLRVFARFGTFKKKKNWIEFSPPTHRFPPPLISTFCCWKHITDMDRTLKSQWLAIFNNVQTKYTPAWWHTIYRRKTLFWIDIPIVYEWRNNFHSYLGFLDLFHFTKPLSTPPTYLASWEDRDYVCYY